MGEGLPRVARRLAPRLAAALATVLALALAGCSTTRVIDSEVRAFAAPKAQTRLQAGTPFRFDRLPSQQAPDAVAAQARLEQLATQALAAAGLAPAPDASVDAALRVQVELRVQRMDRSALDDPWGPFGSPFGLPGRDYIVTGKGQLVPLYAPWRPYFPPTPWLQRELSLIVRDPAGEGVLYETRARHDGPWRDDEAVLQAMFRAALDGFPSGSGQTRQIDVPAPR